MKISNKEIEFNFRVTETATTFYEGKIKILAFTYEQALEKLEEMSIDEISEQVENWELSDDTYGEGDTQVYDNDNNVIKE